MQPVITEKTAVLIACRLSRPIWLFINREQPLMAIVIMTRAKAEFNDVQTATKFISGWWEGKGRWLGQTNTTFTQETTVPVFCPMSCVDLVTSGYVRLRQIMSRYVRLCQVTLDYATLC